MVPAWDVSNRPFSYWFSLEISFVRASVREARALSRRGQQGSRPEGGLGVSRQDCHCPSVNSFNCCWWRWQWRCLCFFFCFVDVLKSPHAAFFVLLHAGCFIIRWIIRAHLSDESIRCFKEMHHQSIGNSFRIKLTDASARCTHRAEGDCFV